MVLLFNIFQKASPHRVDKLFRPGQLVSSAMLSFAHGSNDAQKTMGIIVGLLVASKQYFVGQTGWMRFLYLEDAHRIPYWVELCAYSAISPRHAVRRLAHRAHDGVAHHEAAPGGRILRRDGGRRRDHDGVEVRDSREHHAHHHRRDRRRGGHAPPVGGAVGTRRADRVGLAADDSRRPRRWRRRAISRPLHLGPPFTN